MSSDGRQGVAGETYRRKELAQFVGNRRIGQMGDWGSGLLTCAYLVREPTNAHDQNAVMVRLPHAGSTMLAGYLPARVAPRWQPLLHQLERHGSVAECAAMIYRDGKHFQVVLHVADPAAAVLANDEPDRAVFLAPERECAVIGEKDHQDVLSRFRAGSRVWATLHCGTVASGKYKGESTLRCASAEIVSVRSRL